MPRHLRITYERSTGLYRLFYAASRSTPLKKTASGKLVSARSATGNSACSLAASAWRRKQASPADFKQLAQCRAHAATLKAAHLHRIAGNEAHAQHIEKIASGEFLTRKARKTRADRLKESLKSTRSDRDMRKTPAKEKVPPFKPAATIHEANDWLKSHGIEPHWTSANEPEYEYKITVHDINEVHAGLHPLLSAYPEVASTITRVGSRYAMARNKWLKNFDEHMAEDRAQFERVKRRWRQSEAEKRVRKVMTDEPTIDGDGWDKFGIFEGGAWANLTRRNDGSSPEYLKHYGAEMRFNHRKVVIQSRAKADADRERSLAKGANLPNTGDDYFSIAQHEFGHALDDHFGVSTDPRFKALHESLTHEEVQSGLSDYATTNIKELLAEGFAEGVREDARPLGKKIKSLIDTIVSEKRGK